MEFGLKLKIIKLNIISMITNNYDYITTKHKKKVLRELLYFGNMSIRDYRQTYFTLAT